MQELYDILTSRLESLRGKGDAITLYDISSILNEIGVYLDGGKPEFNMMLQNEIVKIANHVELTKKELMSLVPEQSAQANISQLEAVIKSTEDAAGAILDAADAIQQAMNASDASQAAKDTVTLSVTRIYEACNFQDLTGQRIIKVMRELELVESKIRYLQKLFANEAPVPALELNRKKDMRADQQLLNGPQLPADAPSQADIDVLFKKG